MLLPYLTETKNPSKKYTVSFRGLNLGDGTQDGEFEETYHLSTDKYPCITQSAAQIKSGEYPGATTLHAKEGLLVIAGTKVYYDGTKVGEVLEEGKKQLATVGNYVVIFPDKLYYKVPTEEDENGEFGTMEVSLAETGLVFTSDSISIPAGSQKTFPFQKGDAVTIEQCSESKNNTTIIVRDVTEKKLTFYDNSFVEKTETGEVTITRKVPDLDFICESNYRLWGTEGNVIHASKFSDPLNFNVFDGLSSDSYYIEVGSDEPFTGCIPYSTHICFFKENTLHKLYGTKPSNYQIATANVYGVQSGCERSMHIVNEELLYKGVDGVYAYTGGVPELISGCFGTKRFSEAAASCDGSRYYISMKDEAGKWGLYSYDVQRNIWFREDETHAVDMTFHKGMVYFADERGDLFSIDRTAPRNEIAWSGVFCPMNEVVNERKGYSKFHLRMDLSAGSWVAVDIKTNLDFQWRQVCSVHNTKDEEAKTVTIPILPTRCDSIRIRLRGKGECTVKTFVREFTTGSDV